MIGECPSCSKPLRYPKSCSCGWRLNPDAPLTIKPVELSTEQKERNREQSRAFREYAHRLAEGKIEYIPGEDYE